MTPDLLRQELRLPAATAVFDSRLSNPAVDKVAAGRRPLDLQRRFAVDIGARSWQCSAC